MATDMCLNSCMAYTGPLVDCTTCFYCNTVQYKSVLETETADFKAENDPKEAGPVSMTQVQQFFTVPNGPQLQALWQHSKSANLMKYYTLHTLQVQQEINVNPMQFYDNIFCGSEYLQAVADRKIKENDIFLFSFSYMAWTSLGEKQHSHRRLALDVLVNWDQYRSMYPIYLHIHVQ